MQTTHGRNGKDPLAENRELEERQAAARRIQARKDFNRFRAQLSATIAAGLVLYDKEDTKRDIAETAVSLADEIIQVIQEREHR